MTRPWSQTDNTYLEIIKKCQRDVDLAIVLNKADTVNTDEIDIIKSYVAEKTQQSYICLLFCEFFL